MRDGGTSHRRGRRASALLTVVMGFPLLTGLVAVPASAAPAAPAQDPGTGSRSATVAITELDPTVPGEDDTVSIRGTVTNEGSSPIVDSSVAARQGVLLPGRSAIDESLSRTGWDEAADGAIVRGYGQDIGTVEPGMSRTFALDVPVAELALGSDGVYQVAVGLTGQREDARWDQVLGVGRTVLPWQPGGEAAEEQTRLTMLWPLISSTHLTSQTGADEEQTPAFRDDSLLGEISPGGRLDQLVTLGADLPVTWVIDPDLLASVDAMTEPYQVYSGDDLVNGDGQDEARAWLGRLQDAVEGNEVIALPFGDPDLASLAHQGKDVLGALGQLSTATQTAGVTVETVLDVQASTDYAWPVEGAIDPSIVEVATSAGADRVIARSDSLRPGDSLTYTPSAVRPIGGGTTALVADARLSGLFEGDMTRAGSVSQARQQFLAQTLAITRQDPGNERSIVVAPQRMPTAAQAQAMAQAVTALRDDADWIAFAELSDAASAEPDANANTRVPDGDAYPEELRRQELPTSAFQSMRETQRTLEDFQVILTEPDRVVTPVGNAIRREMSTSWRGREDGAEEYRATVQSGLVALTERVHLIQKSDITLSGRSATIPVTVQNNLVQDVQNMELHLVSSRTLGLEVSEPQVIRISGGHSQSVKFSADARANGRTFLEARLYVDGKPYGEAMRFEASVTSIVPEVMMVIAGGLLLVVLAGIRMYTQRKRASGDGEDPRADGDAPAGETGPDTGGNTAGTSSRSEKLGSDE
ncbi:DUF6049 family protein [Streptomyces sp. SBT349]|uniref:DUF6049 family protein n=1 Tax=Streptomyces sp. SBT349 TaxID=1580539 RepID=UPI00066B9685